MIWRSYVPRSSMGKPKVCQTFNMRVEFLFLVDAHDIFFGILGEACHRQN